MATKRAAKAVSASLDFAFFQFLWQFHQANRGTIRQHYKELTRKFLDFNNPDRNPKAFLRQPQFEERGPHRFRELCCSSAGPGLPVLEH